jgi:hypothetical protein
LRVKCQLVPDSLLCEKLGDPIWIRTLYSL